MLSAESNHTLHSIVYAQTQVEDQTNSDTLGQESTTSPVTQVTNASLYKIIIHNLITLHNLSFPYTFHSQQVSSSPGVPVGLSSSASPLGNSSMESAQVNQGTAVTSNNLTPVTSELPAVVSTITILPQSSPPEMTDAEVKRSKVGRPRTKPQKEKTEWHQHLGGVRHCRYIICSGTMQKKRACDWRLCSCEKRLGISNEAFLMWHALQGCFYRQTQNFRVPTD